MALFRRLCLSGGGLLVSDLNFFLHYLTLLVFFGTTRVLCALSDKSMQNLSRFICNWNVRRAGEWLIKFIRPGMQ